MTQQSASRLDRTWLPSRTRRLSLPGVAQAWLRNRLVVLAYHDVSDVRLFARQMAYIRETMNPLSAEDVCRRQSDAEALPPRGILVTFDDGDRTVYELGLPILRQYEVPAVAFVVSDVIGTERPLWFHEARELVRRQARERDRSVGPTDATVRLLKRIPDAERRRRVAQLRTNVSEAVVQPQLTSSELRAMEAGGVVIGNHTHTHPCLDRCDDGTVTTELTRAHETLTELLGHRPLLFAYPNGNGDQRAERILRQLGYRAAFLFDHRIGVFPAANPFRISRVRVNSTTSMVRFRSIVSGLHPFAHHGLGRR